MRGRYTISRDPARADTFLVIGDDGDSWWLGRSTAGDHEGERMVVQRLSDRVLIADEYTGKVAASGSFVTKNICRPPGAVSRFPELSHYALEGPDLERSEYHLGSAADESLGFILTPDGRRLARIERDTADSATMEVNATLDWRPVLASVHLTMFSAPPRGLLQGLRRRLFG